MLPAAVHLSVDHYLRAADQALPGRIGGFYLVGSVALGDFQPGRSDIDFVAVLTQALDAAELDRLRSLQRRLYLESLVVAVRDRRWPLVCNGAFVRQADLGRSPGQVVPVASHVAGKFSLGRGFDTNPVTWLTLKRYGIAVRGPAPNELNVYHSDAELRKWTLGNLNSYWRQWAIGVQGLGPTAAKALLRRYVAWGVMGTSRMHYTIATGDISSKVQATDYALGLWPRWRSLLDEVRSYWLGTMRPPRISSPFRRRRETAEFVCDVINSAGAIS